MLAVRTCWQVKNKLHHLIHTVNVGLTNTVTALLNLYSSERTSVAIFILSRSIAQAVSRRVLTAEFRFLYEAIPCGICGGRSVTGTDSFPNNSVYPCHYNSTIAQHASSCTCSPLPEGQAVEVWELSAVNINSVVLLLTVVLVASNDRNKNVVKSMYGGGGLT
jgi:hypothetical protein